MAHDAGSAISTVVRCTPAVAGVVGICTGSLVLAGWFQGIDALVRMGPELPSVKLNEAAGFVLAGLALLAAADGRGGAKLFTALRWSMEAALLLLGSVTLMHYAFSWGGTLDQFLSAAPAEPTAASPGRMAPAAAFCLVLCSAALMAEHWRTRGARGASRTLATGAVIVALVSLLGYVYGVPALYWPLPEVSAIAPQSALILLILAAGIVAIHPTVGLPGLAVESSMVGTQLRWLFPAVVILPLTIGGLAVRASPGLITPEMAVVITALGATLGTGLVLGVSAVLLRRSESALQVRNRALAAARQGVFIASGRVSGYPLLYINDAFTAITGYASKAAVGRRLDFLFPRGEQRQEWQRLLAEAIRGGRAPGTVLKSRRQDGTVFSNRLTISTVRGPDGRIENVLGVMEDVTEEELAAKARLELLAEADQARKAAETASRAKDMFLASVTHDLRSPVNACLTWVDVLELGAGDPTLKARAVDAIRRNLKIQARLVSDLVDVAQISAGGIRIEPERTELDALIEGLVETWRLMAAAKDVELSCRRDDGEYHVDVDADRVAQVFNNLFDNALTSTPAGGRIMVHLGSSDGWVEVSVQDTGRGLRAEELRKMFSPFWRGDRHGHKGLGLGLTIAEHLIERHQGSIHARSDGPGRGCTFTVRLPSPGLPIASRLSTRDAVGVLH